MQTAPCEHRRNHETQLAMNYEDLYLSAASKCEELFGIQRKAILYWPGIKTLNILPMGSVPKCSTVFEK